MQISHSCSSPPPSNSCPPSLMPPSLSLTCQVPLQIDRDLGIRPYERLGGSDSGVYTYMYFPTHTHSHFLPTSLRLSFSLFLSHIHTRPYVYMNTHICHGQDALSRARAHTHMHTQAHTHKYVYIYHSRTYIHTCTHISHMRSGHANTRTLALTNICAHLYTCLKQRTHDTLTHTHTHSHPHTHKHTHKHTHTLTRTYTHTHTHTHTQTHRIRRPESKLS